MLENNQGVTTMVQSDVRDSYIRRDDDQGVEAIILAAGRGSRLNSITEDLPKCLVEVGNQSLLDHQLDLLASAGIDQVTVVTGYCADKIEAELRGRAETVFNPVWSQTNSLFSLWLCRERIHNPFVVMNCDVLAHPDILHRLLESGHSAFTYDGTSGEDEEHMKVEIENGILQTMSKSLPAHRSHGENIGILYFDEVIGRMLFREAENALEAGGRNMWMAAAVERVAQNACVSAVDVADLPWAEIDFPEDLDFARRVVWPELCARPCSTRAKRKVAGGAAATATAVHVS